MLKRTSCHFHWEPGEKRWKYLSKVTTVWSKVTLVFMGRSDGVRSTELSDFWWGRNDRIPIINSHGKTILTLQTLSRSIGLLSKIRHFVPFHTLVSIYNCLVVPYLRYGLTAWGQAGKTQLNKLLILQKTCSSFQARRWQVWSRHSFVPSCKDFTYSLFETMHYVNNVIPSQLKDLFIPAAKIHSYNTRSSVSNNFYIKKAKLEIERKSFSRIGAKLWNEIPTKLWTLPKLIFKGKIRMTLFNIIY